eukprot:TRINITY_DN29097_c0_g1_i1.p1 TRINITY_DN29097_c0_g1~~TRINITY_DN29097_c0_g1_i1.p1  ORF type:complete len:532 (+),score=125.14 TRINITY_DN29097_c0_g1_i1:68-1597(+)
MASIDEETGGEGTFENCVGAGRLEGWFLASSFENDKRGWGHISSYCFEGRLFFHLQRSPSLRGVVYRKKDPLSFEVVEFNGRCEAVKLLLPNMTEKGVIPDPEGELRPEPNTMLGETMEGTVRSHWQLVKKQNWGFVGSERFKGMVFWHLTDNPGMTDQVFDRDDVVEFELYVNTTRGEQVRAKNMRFLRKSEKEDPHEPERRLSESKMARKSKWLMNWRKGHPPDWVCKLCAYNNFGRNRVCKGKDCDQQRPPREEWPAEEDDEETTSQSAALQSLPAAFRQQLPVQFQPFTPVQPDLPQQHMQFQADWQQQEQSSQFGMPAAFQPTQMQTQQPMQMQMEMQMQQPMEMQVHQPSKMQTHMQMQQPVQQTWPASDPSQNGGGPFGLPAEQIGQGVSAPSRGSRSLPASSKEEASVELCLSSFDDIVRNGSLGEETVEKVKQYLNEVADVMGNDRAAKQAFSVKLARHPWFASSGYEVRYRPAMGTITVAQSRMAAMKRSADPSWPMFG